MAKFNLNSIYPANSSGYIIIQATVSFLLKTSLNSATIGNVTTDLNFHSKEGRFTDKMGNADQTKENQITEGVIWKQLLLFFFPI